ncbi:MAG: nucleotidyltransferase family protein [Sulfitobacter sp.]
MRKCDNIPIILLAAGSSSRMGGRDKLLEDVGGETLLRRMARRALGADLGSVIVALPPRPHGRYGALAGLAVRMLPVADADEGMNASLGAAIAALPEGCGAAMVMLADMPEITEGDLKTVAQAIDLETDIEVWRGATQAGEPGHPVVFAAKLFEQIKALRGDSGGRAVMGGKLRLVPLPGDHARLDLDTPEAWAAWRARRE